MVVVVVIAVVVIVVVVVPVAAPIAAPIAAPRCPPAEEEDDAPRLQPLRPLDECGELGRCVPSALMGIAGERALVVEGS